MKGAGFTERELLAAGLAKSGKRGGFTTPSGAGSCSRS